MLWLRGLIFTLLVPLVVAGYVPWRIYRGLAIQHGWWTLGWIVLAIGAAVYGACLFAFLSSGGTPAPFFTRHLGAVIGTEPPRVVREGLYRYSRNPMYLGVLLLIFGQALLFKSKEVAIYGAATWLTFHLVVVFLEEPHLRDARGPSYDEYCRRVPRWFGLPKNIAHR